MNETKKALRGLLDNWIGWGVIISIIGTLPSNPIIRVVIVIFGIHLVYWGTIIQHRNDAIYHYLTKITAGEVKE